MKKLAAFAILLTLAAAARAGVVFEVETRDHEGTVEEMSIQVEEPNLAIPVAADKSGRGKGKMIFRGDRGESGQLIVIDDDEKAYFVMDDETMAAIGGQMRDAMKQMEEMIKSLPPEQQEALRKAREQGVNIPGMPAAPAARGKAALRNTGERATKNGYPCVKYEVWREGRKLRQLWVTDWSNVEGGEEVADTFVKMGRFFEAMLAALPELPGGGPMGGGNPYEEMGFAAGFPVETTGYRADGGIEDSSSLRSARRRTIDPAEFEPPAGYKRRSMGPR